MSYTTEPWKVIVPIRGYEAGISTRTPGEFPHSETTIADLPDTQGNGNAHANAARIVDCVNGCAGLTPLTPEGASVFRECVEALASLVKFSHLYLTSSQEVRNIPLFGQPLSEALPQAIKEASHALAHALQRD